MFGTTANMCCFFFTLEGILTYIGISSKYLVKGVFLSSALFAIFAVLAVGSGDSNNSSSSDTSTATSTTNAKKEKNLPAIVQAASNSTSTLPLAKEISNHPEFAQPALRTMAVLASWALTLSVSTYSMFSSRFMGYGQSQLSAAMSLGAATTIMTQIFLVPRLVQKAGVHLSDTIGLWTLSVGLAGTAMLRLQPLHTIFYLLVRVGTGLADTATATLVARYSNGREERGQNLGMIQSSRAAARIFTPVISGTLFSRSCNYRILPGGLPYFVNAALTLVLTPLPLVLKRIDNRRKRNSAGVRE